MKVFLAALLLATVALLLFGAPFATEQLKLKIRWRSPEPILPMSFAHEDHVDQNCLVCHHNYVDDTGGDACMSCHVTNEELWPVLEAQFHDLCRGCHVEQQLAGEESGPTRACIDCHVEEHVP